MSSRLCPYFIDPDTGAALEEENVYTKTYDMVNNFTYITTNRVKQLAKAHYNCDDAIGVPLEDDGGGMYACMIDVCKDNVFIFRF